MAQVNDRKSNLYSQEQSVRDELSAPRHLESAGDELIKRLAKKQTKTSTSLQEQLEIVQNFERGFKLIPFEQKGITSLEDFKNHVLSKQETSTSTDKQEENRNVDQLMKITGLSRHELELGLCEKPNSTISQLYMFAIGNKKQASSDESPEKKMSGHPINHLKELEEEYFGESKNLECASAGETKRGKIKKRGKRKKPRKRKKTIIRNSVNVASEPASVSVQLKKLVEHKEQSPKASTSRPSLWDVKDMKKWSEAKEIGCKPQKLYTIKSGKIIKLEEKYESKDLT